jgi:hypothetical protein
VVSEGRGQSRIGKTAGRLLLAFDAFIDSSMYDGQRRAIRALQAIGAFSDRFRLTGMAKFAIDAACEGLNVGLVGLILALALAQPAFRDTSDDDWLNRRFDVRRPNHNSVIPKLPRTRGRTRIFLELSFCWL